LRAVTGLVDYYSAEVGKLVVEMADVKNKSFVWRGTPSDTLSDKPEKNQKKLDKVHPVRVAQGEKQKVQGVVSIRSGDHSKSETPGGAETSVLLTATTKVSSHSKGLRGKRPIQ
jgi:hypothetical protein